MATHQEVRTDLGMIRRPGLYVDDLTDFKRHSRKHEEECLSNRIFFGFMK